MGGIIGTIKDLLGIHSPSTVMVEVGRNLVQGLVEGIRQWLGNLRTSVVGVKNTVIGALAGAGTWLVGTGRSVVIGFANGVKALYGTARSTASGLKSQATSALSNAGSLLYGHGRNLVIGFVNGVRSLGSYLFNAIYAFVKANVPGPVAKVLGIASPSKLMHEYGGYTTEGLALGMTDKVGLVEDAAARLAEAALPQIPDAVLGLGADADAAISRSLSVADQKSLLLGWKTSATGSRFLDELARMITVEYNSDVTAALTR